ncbi:hypothetical protein MNBD_GAMMA24-855 [hydrothermal vent metagenome]|uniref:Uncharacterized protein n=1 Tax=hydrothermal vent metagenome TaxID=652676 RepID=A0A3B1CCF9_9ZZZZ
MKTFCLLSAMCLGLISSPVFADEGMPKGKSDMQMNSSMSMQDKKGCEKMHGMMNPEKMKGMMQMKKKHMQKMETHLANIEKLLSQLVKLEKQKASVK